MNKKPGTIIAENIQLLHIETVKQIIDASPLKNGKKHLLDMGTRLAYNLKDERCKIELFIRMGADLAKAPVFFHINFHYKVKGLDLFYEMNKDKNSPIFQGHFISTLAGISLSTARGMIYEKLNNAGLKNIILPVVSPQKLLQTTTKS
jgi:hypothetical protein